LCRRFQEALHGFHVRLKIARAFFPTPDGAGNRWWRSSADVARRCCQSSRQDLEGRLSCVQGLKLLCASYSVFQSRFWMMWVLWLCFSGNSLACFVTTFQRAFFLWHNLLDGWFVRVTLKFTNAAYSGSASLSVQCRYRPDHWGCLAPGLRSNRAHSI
jgi:hypothetical protein